MAATKHTPLSPSFTGPFPPNKRTNTSSSITTINSTTSDTLSSANTTPSSSPEPEALVTAYAIKRLISTTTSTIGLFKSLESANDSVYKLRLDYETCDPCFFWYGDGHGFTSISESERAPGEDVERNEKGDCLSWEVFADEDEEEGCRVWVERVEVGVEGVESIGGEGERKCNWREALEPIARPCDFWGTFTVKG